MKINYTLVSCIVSIFITSYSFPQISKEEDPNSLERGNWALIFEMGTFIDTQTFESFLFASKYHISKRLGVRTGFGYSSNTNDATNSVQWGDFEKNYPAGGKNRLLTASASVVFYPISLSAVTLFLGAGTVYRNQSTESNGLWLARTSYGIFEGVIHEERDEWTAGLSGTLGAEWFIFKRVSLVGEYNVSIAWGKNKTKQFETVTDPYNGTVTSFVSDDEGDITKIDADLLRLGIAVYF